ncbi:MAG: type II/IV secretion system ATPase subunit [Candidatus Thermoplasmatota archaeon]|jgi:flagellar protein FlaI|nr:type II/IV secretion system ATPase subunit [Candidatus Thermoplasmatota archaeon]
MGLLEKAQQRKNVLQGTQILQEPKTKEKKTGLLEKAKQRKEVLQKSTTTKGRKKTEPVKEESKKTVKEPQPYLVDERKGFGWKGLGSRKIYFNKEINEYVYEVSEPVLNEEELKIKDELVRLFKMLADINVFGLSKEEKKRHLEEILEQIIVDNDVKFCEEPMKSKGILFGGKSKKDRKIKFGKKTLEENSIKSEGGAKDAIESDNINNMIGSKDKIFYHIFRDFIGYGKIDILMEDEGIEDISCDGHHVPIFIYHKKYDAITTNIRFENDEELDSFVVRLSQICGKQISIYSPIVDGKLPDGSRLQCTLSKTVTKGSTFTIRRFREDPITPIDLIRFKTISLDMAAYFWMAIENGASILFCGGTASGKTSALNALSLFIPASHKIISIEDTREVNLPHSNWIAGTTRQGFSSSDENKTGKDIDMFDLIRAALRQRPRVIIVGEVRGREAYSLFQAMATGHTSYATVHASTIHTLIQRLENPPISLPRALLTSLDIIVFLNAVEIGGKTARRMTSVTEVIKLDPDTNQLIFMEPFSWVSKTDDRFESTGTSKIMNAIKTQNDWTDEQLKRELANRKIILEWMDKKNMRTYQEVGRVVSDYHKYPDVILKKAMEEMKK